MTRRRLAWPVVLITCALVAVGCRFEILDNPSLVFEGNILTRPFVNTSTYMGDGEGLAYVEDDSSLWIADDNGDAIYEVDVTTGALLDEIDDPEFAATPRFGGGPLAGPDRVDDFEALAYDATNDHLYAVSASCCTPNVEPTVFRLTRTQPGGDFEPESWQPLNDDYTALAALPSGQLYIGELSNLRTYDYVSNTVGPAFNIGGITNAIFGLGFSVDGEDLFVASNNTVYRVDWATLTIVTDYEFDMSLEGINGARAVELVGDRIYVLDGDDSLPANDPLKYAIHIFSIDGDERSPLDPVAQFTATPSTGPAPLSVTLDASSSFDPDGTVTQWLWLYGDGTPIADGEIVSHDYTSPGVYTVVLVVIDDAEHFTITTGSVTVL